jgi:hypothetical protein
VRERHRHGLLLAASVNTAVSIGGPGHVAHTRIHKALHSDGQHGH